MVQMATKTTTAASMDLDCRPDDALGLALFLLSIHHRAERKDELTAARAAYDRGEWSRAADLARERLKTDGKDLAALRLLARSSIRMGRDGDGALIYQERLGAEALEPEDAFLLGLASSRLGDEQKALAVWSKAAAESPEHPELLLVTRQPAGPHAAARRIHRAGPAAVHGSRLAGCRVAASGHQPLYRRRPRRGRRGPRSAGSSSTPSAAGAAGPRGLSQASGEVSAFTRPSGRGRPLARTAAGRRRERAGGYRGGLAGQPVGPPAETVRSFQGRACPVRSVSRLATRWFPSRVSIRAPPGAPPATPTSARLTQQPAIRVPFTTARSCSSLPRPTSSLADPDDPKVTHTFVQNGTKLKVRSNIDTRIYEVVVDYAFGTKDRYVTMVGRDGDGGFERLRLSYFHEPTRSGWGRTAGDVGTAADIQNLRGQIVTRPRRCRAVSALPCDESA